MTILDTIAEKTKQRMEEEKRRLSLSELKARVSDMTQDDEEFRFEEALKKQGMSFICEVKKASPSKGLIAPGFPYVDIAKAYESACADAISVLTEPFYFLGSDSYLREIRKAVVTPILRKDFTVDEYMIYQAKEMHADAVLLICSILSKMQLSEYFGLATELGLSALVETHDDAEIETALSVGARIIGVNNRNLRDFTVDSGNSMKLRELVPADKIFVSESGIKTREDVARLEAAGVNAVLVGETLMRSADKKAMLDTLAGRR